MRLKCSMCGSDQYVVAEIKPDEIVYKGELAGATGTTYAQVNQCLKCNTVTHHRLKYKSGTNKYRYINHQGHVMQFHRFVYELVNRKLKPGERVTFRNGNKGDCRPSNLEAIMPKKKKKRKIRHIINVCRRKLCGYVWRQRGKNSPETCPKCRSNNWECEEE